MSCDKEEQNDNAVLDANVGIILQSANGIDLLNPANERSYKKENIDLFYVIDDKPVKQFNGNLNDPEMFRIDNDKSINKYVLTVYANTTPSSQQTLKDGEQTLTYLQLSPTDTDTLKTEFHVANEGNLKAVTKVWYNDVLLQKNNGELGFIVKK